MAALLSVFSAALASSETVYEHRQTVREGRAKTLVTHVTVILATNKEIYSVPERNEHSA